MLSCHFTARRLQRYLDADPAAPLTAAEIHRLEAHVAECVRCAGALEDFRLLRGALRGLALHVGPQPDAVDRMRQLVDDLVEGPAR
jgi:anti-sigma factor RsiW